jgi:hypothetical protein
VVQARIASGLYALSVKENPMPKEVRLSSGQTEAVNQSPSNEESNPVIHIGFLIAKCPVCGVEIDGDSDYNYVVGGHLRCDVSRMLTHVLFRSCTDHCEQAKELPICKKSEHRSPGYVGEWEPKWGITARVVQVGKEVKAVVKTVRIV